MMETLQHDNKAATSTNDETMHLLSTSGSINTDNIRENISSRSVHTESVWVTALQMFIPFILAGFGMVAASYLLDTVQYWPVYVNITDVYILVPSLLGLKGNLEMTLASRLSTHANLGNFDDQQERRTLISGNLALVLSQAIVVGFLASVAAGTLGSVRSGVVNVKYMLLLCSSSVVTAITASFILGVVMISVIVLSRRYHINPDNVATPIAASLGDLTTLACLSAIATFYYNLIETHWYLTIIFLVVSLLLAPISAYMAYHNKYTKQVLYNGWTPVIAAMTISSLGGLVLDVTISRFKGVAIFQLIINGVGGNLAAVQASRMSTELHHAGKLGSSPHSISVWMTPWDAFFDKTKTSHARTAKMLLIMCVPGHLIFLCTVSILEAGQTSITPIFVSVYCVIGFVQVFILLYMAEILTLFMWKRGIDPDNSAIPYLTAFGDLLGTLLLGIGFQILYNIGDMDSDVGD